MLENKFHYIRPEDYTKRFSGILKPTPETKIRPRTERDYSRWSSKQRKRIPKKIRQRVIHNEQKRVQKIKSG